MTQKQIDTLKSSLPSLCSGLWKEWTAEQKSLRDELSCRETINSCLVYEGVKRGITLFFEKRSSGFFAESYAAKYIRIFGEDRVKEIVNEQVKDFENAKVNYGVYEDEEGVFYNIVQWPDE